MIIIFKSIGMASRCALVYAVLLGTQMALSHEDKSAHEDVQKTVIDFLNSISTDNLKHVKSFKKAENEAFAQIQTPRATVLIVL